MATNKSNDTCRTNSWLAAVVLGILGFLLAWRWIEWGFISSLVIGLVIFFLLGYVLISMFCSSEAEQSAPSRPAEPAPAPAAKTEAIAAPDPVVSAAPEPAEKPVAEKAPTKKPAAKKPAAKKPAAKKPAAKKPAAKKKPAEPKGPTKPAELAAARGGKADDLKVIKGVGPGLETTLNENGIWHYDQIAAWSVADVAYVDENMLRFKGRATRDGWVKQAAKLAKGGA
ncbi:MAG: putative flap endonuclease-1-like 5' DNA nuclease [Paracoccaceae bacterium]|jgi:predicted flap endonuclease-1-like 5' DNA nuclease